MQASLARLGRAPTDSAFDEHVRIPAWRRRFTRYEAIAALRNAVMAYELTAVQRINA